VPPLPLRTALRRACADSWLVARRNPWMLCLPVVVMWFAFTTAEERCVFLDKELEAARTETAQ
jgi:hypothetical protein